MSGYIEMLAEQARVRPVTLSEASDRALSELDALVAQLAAELRVEYLGPGVGVEGATEVYRLAVRAHRPNFGPPVWGVRICDASPAADWRVVWAIPAAGRRRKVAVIAALPGFFQGYAQAIEATGKGETAAGRRVRAVARAFSPPR